MILLVQTQNKHFWFLVAEISIFDIFQRYFVHASKIHNNLPLLFSPPGNLRPASRKNQHRLPKVQLRHPNEKRHQQPIDN